MKRFKLYGTSACHLCELAEAMLDGLVAQGLALDYDKVDISDSDELFHRYGLVIPVVQSPAGAELAWPFEEAELRRFIGAC